MVDVPSGPRRVRLDVTGCTREMIRAEWDKGCSDDASLASSLFTPFPGCKMLQVCILFGKCCVPSTHTQTHTHACLPS